MASKSPLNTGPVTRRTSPTSPYVGSIPFGEMPTSGSASDPSGNTSPTYHNFYSHFNGFHHSPGFLGQTASRTGNDGGFSGTGLYVYPPYRSPNGELPSSQNIMYSPDSHADFSGRGNFDDSQTGSDAENNAASRQGHDARRNLNIFKGKSSEINPTGTIYTDMTPFHPVPQHSDPQGHKLPNYITYSYAGDQPQHPGYNGQLSPPTSTHVYYNREPVAGAPSYYSWTPGGVSQGHQGSERKIRRLGTGSSRTNFTAKGKDACTVSLYNGDMWTKFHAHTNEMIITKHGRRMFPVLHYVIGGLDPEKLYHVYVDMVVADGSHWKFQGGKWISCGAAEPLPAEGRVYHHPDSPNTGAHWMKQDLSFGKLKLTNNKSSKQKQIILNSMHRYQPRIHIAEDAGGGQQGEVIIAHGFVATQFIAVTAYQNTDITDLKVKFNPYARGMQDKTNRLGFEPSDPHNMASGSCDQANVSSNFSGPSPNHSLPHQNGYSLCVPASPLLMSNRSHLYQRTNAASQAYPPSDVFHTPYKNGSFDIGQDLPFHQTHGLPAHAQRPGMDGFSNNGDPINANSGIQFLTNSGHAYGVSSLSLASLPAEDTKGGHSPSSCSYTGHASVTPPDNQDFRTSPQSQDFTTPPHSSTAPAASPSLIHLSRVPTFSCFGSLSPENVPAHQHPDKNVGRDFLENRNHFFHQEPTSMMYSSSNNQTATAYNSLDNIEHPQSPHLSNFITQTTGSKDQDEEAAREFGQLQKIAAELSLDFLSKSPRSQTISRKRKLVSVEQGE